MLPAYRESRPSVEVEQVVACLWEHEPANDRAQGVVPDGCMDVIWLAERELVIAGVDTVSRSVDRRNPAVGYLVGEAVVVDVTATVGKRRRHSVLGQDHIPLANHRPGLECNVYEESRVVIGHECHDRITVKVVETSR